MDCLFQGRFSQESNESKTVLVVGFHGGGGGMTIFRIFPDFANRPATSDGLVSGGRRETKMVFFARG